MRSNPETCLKYFPSRTKCKDFSEGKVKVLIRQMRQKGALQPLIGVGGWVGA